MEKTKLTFWPTQYISYKMTQFLPAWFLNSLPKMFRNRLTMLVAKNIFNSYMRKILDKNRISSEEDQFFLFFLI